MNPKLTIVLTIYNKEPFLRKAFEGLLSQENSNDGDFEVLAVNDGSTDGSSEIIKEYQKRDSRVRVLTQDNQGLSMARNNGTDVAKGDYVWYVDADDVISPKSVRLICDAMTSQPDIIPIYATTEGEEGVRNSIPLTARTGQDVLLCGKWQPCGVFNVFRRAFLKENNLRFLPGIYHEDSEFTPRMLYKAKTVVVVPEILYTVIREPNSITQVPREKRAFDYLIVADNLNKFKCEHTEMSHTLAKVFDDRISAAINNGFSIIVRNTKDGQIRFNNDLREKAYLLKALRGSSQKKYNYEGLLFQIVFGHYVWAYKLMRVFTRVKNFFK